MTFFFNGGLETPYSREDRLLVPSPKVATSDLQPLFDVIYNVLPEPSATVDAPLQAHVTNLDASDFLGRIALLRIYAGRIKKGQQVAWIHYDEDGNQHTKTVKVAELLRTVGFERQPAEEAMHMAILVATNIKNQRIRGLSIY